MEYTYHQHDKRCEIMLSGQFTFMDHQKFRGLLALFDGSKMSSVVLDFSQVSFVDSAALGMLLLAKDKAAQQRVVLVLAQAEGQVKRLFELSNFNSLFQTEFR